MESLINNIKAKSAGISQILKNSQSWLLLKEWLINELSYTSNAIDGSVLSRKDNAMAISKNIASSSKPIKDYIMARNHARAFNLVLEIIKRKIPLTEDDILKIHKEIINGLINSDLGQDNKLAAQSPVILKIPDNSGHKPALLQELLEYLKADNIWPPEQAAVAHLKLVSLNLFAYKNFQTARLLMNLVLLKNAYPPIIIRPRDKKQYLKLTETALRTNNLEPYIKFIYTAFGRSLQTYENIFSGHKQHNQNGKLLKISQFAKAAGVPVSTIRYYLRSGKVKPVAVSLGDYMLFSNEQADGIKALKSKNNA